MKCTCNAHQLENFGCECGAEEHPSPNGLDYLIELTERANKADEFFQAHESLMVRLCRILKLDYVDATDEEVIECVRNLMDSNQE